ncbi:DUF2971 domain-containing protein [Pseudomonas sp. CC120222-01a]|uniref:DUF2971 domain-containing protein n=1 Tax=Pseudomonas sp. CC120222-01a TaxID=1378075 RepID=UPI000D8F0FC5|nr:DUF2971 domain-containing protein [Pseudomonas sp. CC120222-01a]PVZ42558.1 Protein of unknown function (DUF2971) [Pseudomonas sp. CC120222-01a]
MTAENPTEFYRFRPIHRLLGEPGTPEVLGDDGSCIKPAKPAKIGELEGNYIFFPSPESLNDPFEGYTKFHWSGDTIIWANLIKHYTWSLADNLAMKMLEIENLPIVPAPSHIAPKMRAIYNEAAELVITNERIQAHISELASSERRVSKAELHALLMVINPIVLDEITKTFLKYKMLEEATNLWDGNTALSDALLNVQVHANQNKSPDIETEAHFLSLSVLLRASAFTVAYARTQSKLPITPASNFPSHYIDSLPGLTHSPWYVACFMSSCTNSAIWGSYGDNHRGACLIFDTIPNDDLDRCLMLTVPWEEQEGWGTRPWRAKLQKVDYNDKPLELNFFECLSLMTRSQLDAYWLEDGHKNRSTTSRGYGSDQSRDKYWNDLDTRLARKWKDWAQENEYRIVYNPSMMDASKAEHRQLKYEFSALKGICFGLKTEFEDILAIVNKIIELCETHDRDEFAFKQAIHDPISNTLKIVPLFSLAQIRQTTDQNPLKRD